MSPSKCHSSCQSIHNLSNILISTLVGSTCFTALFPLNLIYLCVCICICMWVYAYVHRCACVHELMEVRQQLHLLLRFWTQDLSYPGLCQVRKGACPRITRGLSTSPALRIWSGVTTPGRLHGCLGLNSVLSVSKSWTFLTRLSPSVCVCVYPFLFNLLGSMCVHAWMYYVRVYVPKWARIWVMSVF